MLVDDVDAIDVATLGPIYERQFPTGANVEWIQVTGQNSMRMRVWERGAGMTQACGTGACAAVVAGVLTERSARRATVSLLGGELAIEHGEDGVVRMTGPAVEVFTTSVEVAVDAPAHAEAR